MKNKSFSTFILTILLIVCTSLGSVSNGLSNMPNIIAESAIVMDMDTGEVIASKNAKVQRPVASTIKLLTSLIFAENISRGDMISFTEESLKTTQTALNNLKRINVGDKISSDDLMKAVMIYSANDAAYLMADAVSGNYKDFVKIIFSKPYFFAVSAIWLEVSPSKTKHLTLPSNSFAHSSKVTFLS